MNPAEQPLDISARTFAGEEEGDSSESSSSPYFFHNLDTSVVGKQQRQSLLPATPLHRSSSSSAAGVGIKAALAPLQKLLVKAVKGTPNSGNPKRYHRSSSGSRSRRSSMESLVSYGSTYSEGGDTISHYTYHDAEFQDFGVGNEDQNPSYEDPFLNGGNYSQTIRNLEFCRRHTYSVLLVLTLVVILFGVTSVDPVFVAERCQRFLLSANSLSLRSAIAP